MNENDVLIIKSLLKELDETIDNGYGPFLAAIYDENYNLISKERNSVVKSNLSLAHAEINTIKAAEEKLKTYNLAPYSLSIYITSEPCIMCLGAIMWAGIKKIYYSAPSISVEKITGFDEGFKPNWIEEFKKRGIKVFPDIEKIEGERILEKYVKLNGVIYKPEN